MLSYITRSFEDLIQHTSHLSVERIAGILYHLCGSSRYLQQDAWTMMPIIAHKIDWKRNKAIYYEWLSLMHPEMENGKPLYTFLTTDYPETIFRIVLSEFNAHNNVMQHWFRFHMYKDIWFSFRNKQLLSESPPLNIKGNLSYREEKSSFRGGYVFPPKSCSNCHHSLISDECTNFRCKMSPFSYPTLRIDYMKSLCGGDIFYGGKPNTQSG